MLRPRRGVLPLALCLLLLAGCFDPPVRESVRLRFLSNGLVAVTSDVVLDLAADEKNPALARRMAEVRQAVLEGWDPWARRFSGIEPAAERFAWEKRLGRLYTARRSALLAEPAMLRDLFADTPLSVDYQVRDDGVAELFIAPGVPSQATRRQRRDLERAIGEWSGHVAEYLAAVGELYDWLEDNPTRARAAFARLFAGMEIDEGNGDPVELTPGEEQRVDRVRDAMDRVTDVLLVPKGQDRSVDELSHLVYDPFPAPLTLHLPEPPLEIEGFQPAGGTEDKGQDWTVDTPGLWNALRGLEERWIAPDPVLVYVAHAGREEELDLDAFLEAPRAVVRPLPNSLEVKRALEAGLKPASPVYRAVWNARPPAEVEDGEISWDE